MSEALKEILKYCPYKEPRDTEFYTMLRRGMSYEVECNGRNGYTHNYKEFGVFPRDLAFSNVEYIEGGGCLRFNIEKDLLDSIVTKFNQLQAELAKKDEQLEDCEEVLKNLKFTVMDYGVEEESLVMMMAYEEANKYFQKYGKDNSDE